MLSRSVYENTKRDIQEHANEYTRQLTAETAETKHIQEVLKSAKRAANSYHSAIVTTVFNRLREVGNHAVDYYVPGIDELEREREVSLAIDHLVHNRYYGLTLPQRLKQSHVQLNYNIRRSAVTGAKLDTRIRNVQRVFNDTYPYGAHKSWDIRLFLAEAVRLEHILAQNLATRKNIKLLRWTLSQSHSEVDHCDELANAVDPQVKTYLEVNSIKLDPGGIYFVQDIPAIPHPNCQCVIRYVRRVPKRKPAPKPSTSLIKRIINAIFRRK